MAKRSIILVHHLRESSRELWRTQCELQISSGAVMEAQHLALCKMEEARPCLQKLEGLEGQLNFAREKVTNAEAASFEDAVQSNGELVRVQNGHKYSRQGMASIKNSVLVSHKELEVVLAKDSSLDS